MNDTQLKIIADMTVELTKIRQSACKHLSVENFAPKLFRVLIGVAKGYHPDDLKAIKQEEAMPINRETIAFERKLRSSEWKEESA